MPKTVGRISGYVAGRNVAALVFQRNKHIINVFVWPAQETNSEPARVKSRQGYNLIHWSEEGMIFWAVSDLNEKELMEFVHAFAADQNSHPLRSMEKLGR